MRSGEPPHPHPEVALASAAPQKEGARRARRKRLSRRRRRRRVGTELSRTLSLASQMALLCPSGMDVWMHRELSGDLGVERRQ